MKTPHNLETAADQIELKYPNYRKYMECQSRTFMNGVGCLFATSLFGILGSQFLPAEKAPRYLLQLRKISFPLSVAIGSVIGYWITSMGTKSCQDMWVVMETDEKIVRRQQD